MQILQVPGWMLIVIILLLLVTIVTNFASSIQEDGEQMDGIRNPTTQFLNKITGLPVISTEVIVLLVAVALWLN